MGADQFSVQLPVLDDGGSVCTQHHPAGQCNEITGANLHENMDTVAQPQIRGKAVIHLGVGHIGHRSVNSLNLGIRIQQQRLIQQMDTPVQNHAAALFRLLTPVAGDTVRAMNTGFNSEYRAQFALCQNLFDRQEVLVPTTVLVHRQEFTGAFRRLHHGLKISGVNGNGFLADYVLTSFHCLNCQRPVQIIGCRNQHQIHRFIRQKCIQAIVYEIISG